MLATGDYGVHPRPDVPASMSGWWPPCHSPFEQQWARSASNWSWPASTAIWFNCLTDAGVTLLVDLTQDHCADCKGCTATEGCKGNTIGSVDSPPPAQ